MVKAPTLSATNEITFVSPALMVSLIPYSSMVNPSLIGDLFSTVTLTESPFLTTHSSGSLRTLKARMLFTVTPSTFSSGIEVS